MRHPDKRKLLTWLLAALFIALPALAQSSYRAPKPEQSVKVSLGQGLTGADLERVRTGHQGGLLKVVGKDGATMFLKGEALGSGGIDGREWAPLSKAERDQIVKALAVGDPNALANSLMTNYTRISRAPALALLGVLAYPGAETPALKADLRAKVLQFCRNRIQPAEDNIVRRQAVLALSIQPSTDAQTVASMLNFLRRDHNAWNTFGTVQFFEYQAAAIRKMPLYQSYLTQLLASGNPHTDQLVAVLKKTPQAPLTMPATRPPAATTQPAAQPSQPPATNPAGPKPEEVRLPPPPAPEVDARPTPIP